MHVERADGARGTQPTRGPEAAPERLKSPADHQPTPAKAESPGSLSLSERARELKAALRAVGATADAREDRVAELRRRIDAGTYHVSTDALVQDILHGGL